MAQLGMDADAIDQLGNQLQHQADEIGTLVNTINHIVGQMQADWWGPDAQRFCNEWWPQHQRELITAQQNVSGLAQSAHNNASQQRQVSNQ